MNELVVVDTSFWIDFSRGLASDAETAVLENAMVAGQSVMLQIVWLELVVGFRSPAERNLIRDIRGVCRWEPFAEADGTAAEEVAGLLRTKGVLLGASDLLILAVARRLGAALLHHDADFTRVLKLAEFAALRVG